MNLSFKFHITRRVQRAAAISLGSYFMMNSIAVRIQWFVSGSVPSGNMPEENRNLIEVYCQYYTAVFLHCQVNSTPCTAKLTANRDLPCSSYGALLLLLGTGHLLKNK